MSWQLPDADVLVNRNRQGGSLQDPLATTLVTGSNLSYHVDNMRYLSAFPRPGEAPGACFADPGARPTRIALG